MKLNNYINILKEKLNNNYHTYRYKLDKDNSIIFNFYTWFTKSNIEIKINIDFNIINHIGDTYKNTLSNRFLEKSYTTSYYTLYFCIPFNKNKIKNVKIKNNKQEDEIQIIKELNNYSSQNIKCSISNKNLNFENIASSKYYLSNSISKYYLFNSTTRNIQTFTLTNIKTKDKAELNIFSEINNSTLNFCFDFHKEYLSILKILRKHLKEILNIDIHDDKTSCKTNISLYDLGDIISTTLFKVSSQDILKEFNKLKNKLDVESSKKLILITNLVKNIEN